MDRTRRVLSAVVAAVALAACGGGPRDADDTTAAPTTAAPSTTGALPAEGTGPHLVARSATAVDIYAAPDGPVAQTLPATTEFGSPRALLVIQDAGTWLEVALPERPNGSTGWIPRDQVELREVTLALEIDLAALTLTLRDGKEVVLTTPIAIGSAEYPTPTGAFYVVDKLATGEPDGAYGPFAFGLSAHSDVLTEFAGGDGQVGVHGTNDPSSIGQAVSHGCIRVPNEVAETLNQLVELGTPVTIL